MPAVVVRPRPSAEPVSVAERDYFRRPAFHVRVGAVGLVATTLFAILFLRLWSLEMIQGRQFAHAARARAFRTVHFPTARGPILDRSDRLLAGTSGAVVVSADPATLGTLDPHGRWTPSPTGRARVRHLAWVARVPNRRLLADIRRSVRRSPFAPAVVIPRPSAALASYLDERARDFRGFTVTVLPNRSYPRGALGGEFLGLLGEVNSRELRKHRYRGARLGQIVGQSGVEATYDNALDGVRGFKTTGLPGELHSRA